MSELEKRIENIEAINDINQCLTRYCRALDWSDEDLLKTCFLDNGHIDYVSLLECSSIILGFGLLIFTLIFTKNCMVIAIERQMECCSLMSNGSIFFVKNFHRPSRCLLFEILEKTLIHQSFLPEL